jgi:hypothetical protein
MKASDIGAGRQARSAFRVAHRMLKEPFGEQQRYTLARW